ncbi:hypothetical protein FO488_00370 [Geobacter sp. FeAm09]|uniref:TraK domain-containing protein n=1 Tax=Geobacter sp. FeAm09 TaxID=2597769 RepID=UPI0011EC1F51|nr:type-F conjugative transfer system secretin TraK [Geobacter sp. FeAm09]QEM66761.1 hypothetical protein FO488_00370 [Geobacter sp. FeAm09]
MQNKLLFIPFVLLATAAFSADQEMVLQPDKIVPATAEKTVPAGKGGQDSTNFYAYGDKPKKEPAVKKVQQAVEAPNKSPQEVYDEVPLPPTTPDDMSGGQVALPIITQKAKMSRTDNNWVICNDGAIKDIWTSDEKHVKKSYPTTSSGLIKFQFLTDGTKVIYPDPIPTEMHIPCGDVIYSIVGVPMGVPTQTIRLGSGKATKMRDNITMFRDDDTKKKITEIIRRAYSDDLPDSFDIKAESTPVTIFKDVSITLKRTITIDGEGIILKEFYIVPQVDGIEFASENDFRRKEISANPLAIAAIGILPQKPAKGERARMFVVELKAVQEEEISSDGK